MPMEYYLQVTTSLSYFTQEPLCDNYLKLHGMLFQTLHVVGSSCSVVYYVVNYNLQQCFIAACRQTMWSVHKCSSPHGRHKFRAFSMQVRWHPIVPRHILQCNDSKSRTLNAQRSHGAKVTKVEQNRCLGDIRADPMTIHLFPWIPQ